MRGDDKKAEVGYCDGCFDLMHAGHFNALRQAAARCGRLVVGIHADAEIARYKGPTVLRQDERYAMLRHLRWVDGVLEGAPYEPTAETLRRAGADACFHGDDLPAVSASGEHAYGALEREGKFRTFARTPGVSTTHISSRLLELAQHQQAGGNNSKEGGGGGADRSLPPAGPVSMELLRAFAPCAAKGGACVLVPSTFDLFHAGHASVLERAAGLGLRVVAGVVDSRDAVVPLAQRAVAVAACRWVDGVVIGVGASASDAELDEFGVEVVVAHAFDPQRELRAPPQAAASRRGTLREIRGERDYLTKAEILRRVREGADAYAERNRACRAKPGAPAW